ncbi:MAG: C-terminal binding protein [Actinomycetota bacterium]|nr:C-terminal binding protein [Actinomycetota bacterium]
MDALNRGRVVITDHPWPGTDVEASICAAAGYELVDASSAQGAAEVGRLARDAVGILTNWFPVTASLIDSCPRLRVVARLGVGVDNIDVAAAASHGVVVTRVPDYCVEEVSDHAVAMVLDWARGISFFDREVRAGRFDPGARELRRVRNLVVGIWGAGRNGTATGRKLAGFGCSVLVDDRHPGRTDLTPVPVDELLARSDVVSVHLPLTEETRGIVGERTLSSMRRGSLLVNTGRGRLVDVDALAAALDAGRPGAAALDVLPDEPSIPAALAGRDDVLITPHVAFSSVESVAEVRRRATEDLVRVLSGEAPHDPYP